MRLKSFEEALEQVRIWDMGQLIRDCVPYQAASLRSLFNAA